MKLQPSGPCSTHAYHGNVLFTENFLPAKINRHPEKGCIDPFLSLYLISIAIRVNLESLFRVVMARESDWRGNTS
jgi:hypothetical protein